eukprot:363107-Chlamydomonas_euryale.AAC.15
MKSASLQRLAWRAGLAVLGVYVFCPDGAYQSMLDQLSQLLAQLAGGTAAAGATPLLLHVDSATRKMAAREGDGASPLRTAKPVELKFSPCVNQLVCLTAW